MNENNSYITDSEFKKLPLLTKYKVVSEKGYYVHKRIYRGMEVYLYKIDDFYVEVWKRYMLHQIEWIEVAPNDVIEKYAEQVNLNQLLNK